MTRLFVAMIIAVLAVQPNSARAAGAGKPVFGYLNPKTDIFSPSPKPEAVTRTAAPIYRKGILVVTGTVMIAPSVGPTATFSASVQATATDTTISTPSPAAPP
jgi:hypothetical protein